MPIIEWATFLTAFRAHRQDCCRQVQTYLVCLSMWRDKINQWAILLGHAVAAAAATRLCSLTLGRTPATNLSQLQDEEYCGQHCAAGWSWIRPSRW